MTKGAAVEVAPGDGHRVWISVPEVDLAYALLLRNLPTVTALTIRTVKSH